MIDLRLGFPAALVLFSQITAVPTLAQWSNDASVNQAVGDAPSDQNQSKLAPTQGGGAWISWFDGIGSGWDVRLQRLDSLGQEAFAHNGILVADRSFSSTQDYGLDVASNGDALLAYRDDSSGNVEISAARVTPFGTTPWGPSGVQLTSNVGFVAAPKIAGTADGGAVVAWTENTAVKLQKLDASGSPVWAVPVSLAPAAGNYFVSDLHDTGDDVILSIVHQVGNFNSPKHLLAQKIDATGALPWGTTPVDIFNAGSLQFGNFPAFTTDSAGGAVFAWYSASPALQCFAQRVDTAGNELWTHNGVAVATAPGQLRVAPHVTYDAAANAVFVAWIELNFAQSQQGLSVQRFDQAGNRLWSSDGVVLVPLGSNEVGMARAIHDGSAAGALVAWAEAPSFGAARLYGAHVDATGTVDVPRFDVCSITSNKSRMAALRTTSDFAVLAWTDGRADAGDIYAQNVRFDGTLGKAPAIGQAYCTAATNSTGQPAVIEATGSSVADTNDVVLGATDVPPNSFGYFLTSDGQANVPMAGGSQGTLCLGGSTIGRYNAFAQIRNSGPTGTFALVLDLTEHPTSTGLTVVAAGQTWNFQAWYRDMNPGLTSNFTDAVQVDFL